MLVASSTTQERNTARNTEKVQGPFFCPECQAEVVLKKGPKRAHHFSHKPPVNCIYGSGESELHYKAKYEIYGALTGHPNCSNCELESRLDGVRPDICLYINGKYVAIEVQKSTITIDDIVRRTIRYTELGMYLLWVVPHSEPKTHYRKNERVYAYRIKEWEKYLHAMYYGRIYLWQEQAFVVPYHFDEFKIWKEESQWYDEYGDEQYGGGYFRRAKSLRLPKSYSKRQHIAEDFVAKRRDSFVISGRDIPSCNLWKDNLRNWW